MQKSFTAKSSLEHNIVGVDHVLNSVVIAFDDGKEFIYSAATLYALIPANFDVAKQIEKLIH
jgi:hypothetical protein